ncbi:MAG: phenylacetate--CoA ligase family protein [Candidatus Hodarchaeota archaeon]
MENIHYISKYYSLRQLLKSQWTSKTILEELQLKKLRNIVNFAYKNCEYYNKLMKQSNVYPSDINKLEDIRKIPVLTKKKLRVNFEKILPYNVNLEDCWRPRTSGSTGIPLKLVFDKKAENFTNAVLLRANITVGQRLRDSWVSIIKQSSQKKRWFQKFGILYPQRMFYMAPEDLFERISKINPKILSGYASAILVLAKYIQESGKSLKIKPKCVFPTGEILQPNMRKFMNDVFNTKVFDRFGCAELGRTAWECEKHEGYHIDMEAVIVEILSEDFTVLDDGKLGQIAYTGLYNYSFPLIRYLVGDIAQMSDEECSCGRGLSMLRKISGRSDSFIVNDKGEIFSFRALTTSLREFNEILQYKVIQENSKLIMIKIIPNLHWRPDSSERIIRAIQNIIGKGVKVVIKLVDNIPYETSGKILSVKSKIDLRI